MEITCWYLEEQRFVDYRSHMRWNMNIIIFVDGMWYGRTSYRMMYGED